MVSAARTLAAESAEAEAKAALSARDPRRAIAVLMRAYGTELFRFCREQLSDQEAAQDLLQVVFIQAFQSLDGYEPRSTLRAWLYGIARHRCLDAQKNRRRWARVVEPHHEAEGEPPDRPDAAPSGEEHLGARDLRAALEDCVQRLSATARETVLLRFRAELAYEEMAEACGEKIGTLRVRVARALPVLRKCLEEKEMSP